MAKAMPRISSSRNGHIDLRKSAHRIPKGVIHVQASFNNTIVTVRVYGAAWFPGPRLILAHLRVQEEGHPLQLKLYVGPTRVS